MRLPPPFRVALRVPPVARLSARMGTAAFASFAISDSAPR